MALAAQRQSNTWEWRSLLTRRTRSEFQKSR
jgi:hypothetical protein